ncbi:hypothetical protein GC194_06470 [bacterium]|nr:hypothetical protein [bacterium]
MVKNILFAFTLAAALFMYACSSPKVSFSYLQPAAVNLPSNIQKIVVVDHSAMKDGTWNVIEGALTGEGIGQDVEGVLNLIAGIREIGAESNRYVIEKESMRYGQGKLLENIPNPMDMSLIKDIGNKHQADAVLAIDKFDSDFIVTNAKLKDKPNPDDTTKKIEQYKVTGVATIVAYIRVYEVATGNILDEIKHRNSFSWNATGNSVDDAVKKLMQKQLAVNQVAYQAGIAYGKRIAPAEVYVTRVLYKRPKNKHVAFDRGVRKAEVGDWYGASADFEEATKGADNKIKGKAAYNLAVCYEVLGKLEEAQAWAQDAYVKFGLSKGKEYQAILQQRIYDRDELIRQMERPAEDDSNYNNN